MLKPMEIAIRTEMDEKGVSNKYLDEILKSVVKALEKPLYAKNGKVLSFKEVISNQVAPFIGR